MPNLIEKFGIRKCVFIAVVIILVLLSIESRNVLDIGYLCIFVIYGIRFYIAGKQRD